ncbi:MAG: hypothetical protein ABIN61_01050 [candidate division WOR-3 bacterium]
MKKSKFNDIFTYGFSWLVFTLFLFYMGFYNRGLQIGKALLLVLGTIAIGGLIIPLLLRRYWKNQIYLPQLILVCILGILLLFLATKMYRLVFFISVFTWGYITTMRFSFSKHKNEIDEKNSIYTKFADALDIMLFMVVFGIFWLISSIFKVETLLGYDITLFGPLLGVWVVLLYRIISMIAQKVPNKTKVLRILLLCEIGIFVYLFLARVICR